MDYEKKYKEALEKARQLCVYPTSKPFISDLQDLFPELKEPENERIRKELIKFVKVNIPNEERYIVWLEKQDRTKLIMNVPPRDVILSIWDLGNEWKELTNGSISTEHGTQLDYIQKHWEESEYYLRAKQGEQKPADKVKFKVGDWVVSPNGVYWHIDKISNNRYEVTSNTGESSNWNLDTNIYHRFTIQDAKAGDVLEFGDHGRLVVGIVSHVNKTTGKVDVSCLLEDDKFKVGVFYNLDTVKPHPATKDQCNTLFAKMKEAGYEFDFDKKELKEIESKFKVGEWIVNNTNKNVVFLVRSVNNGYYTLEDIKGNTLSPCLQPCERDFHLWSLDDAKDGDILITIEDKYPFIYKGCLDPNHPGLPVAYCGIDSEGYFTPSSVDTFNQWWSDEKVQPATKAQRDNFYIKMKESGYEWDTEKKELKKIEQKPTAWNGEDNTYYDDICEILINLIHSETAKVNKDVVQKDLDWLMSIQQRIETK